MLLCDVVDTVVVGNKRAVLWRYGSGVRGVHAQRDAAGVGAERKSFSLNEPQFVTLDHDSALVGKDEAGVVGPGVVRNCDLLVREHAGHVARLVDVEIHAQDNRPLRHSWPRACRTLRLHRPDNQVNYGSRVDGVARFLNDDTLRSGEDLRRGVMIGPRERTPRW